MGFEKYKSKEIYLMCYIVFFFQDIAEKAVRKKKPRVEIEYETEPIANMSRKKIKH